LTETTLFIKNTPIVRVLESFNGDLYFIAEEKGDEIYCYARLYSMPDCAEWGHNSLRELRKGYGRDKIWDIPKAHWSNLFTYNVEGLVIL
jgi:hypothetical protein